MGIELKTCRYASKRPDDGAVRTPLRELAAVRRQFGYRRLGLLLDRERIVLNHKKLYRLYREERLTASSLNSRVSFRRSMIHLRFHVDT